MCKLRRSRVALYSLVAMAWPMAARAQDLSGVWDWAKSMRLSDGSLRAEREVWVLVEDRGQIEGTCRRWVRHVAPEGKVFPCSRLRSYVTEAEFVLKGVRRGRRVRLREVSVKVTPGPCETGQRTLESYRGRLLGSGRLELRWTGGRQVLVRRNLSGVWWGGGQWTLPNGDTARWWEEWRIVDRAGHVEGIRDRRDTRYSNDGQTFKCNRSLAIVRQVRWRVEGRVKVDRLSVTASQPVVRHGPCEVRRLRPRRIVLRLTRDPSVLRVEGVERSFLLHREDELPAAVGVQASQGGRK